MLPLGILFTGMTHSGKENYQFASDNTSGICPEAWQAMQTANHGNAPSYGDDLWTKEAADLIRSVFEVECDVFFVFNGTAANSLSLSSLCQSYHCVLCHELAHIERDECGAPEFFSNGTKLITLPGALGKLEPDTVAKAITARNDLHFPKARVLALTQSTEYGTVYTVDEIASLCAVAKSKGLAVHMDGARFANAAAALAERDHARPADITWRAGVDVLSFGGSKNGMTTTEAVVFFNPQLSHEFEYRCKQAGQLASKMRFHSAQWTGMLAGGAWLKHAHHANHQARKLGAALTALPGFKLSAPIDANAVFIHFPPGVAEKMLADGWHFYSFIGGGGHRLMCSWATADADIDQFVEAIKKTLC